MPCVIAGPIWHGPIWLGPIWHGPVWHGPIWHGPIWHGPVWHGPVWHGPAARGVEAARTKSVPPAHGFASSPRIERCRPKGAGASAAARGDQAPGRIRLR